MLMRKIRTKRCRCGDRANALDRDPALNLKSVEMSLVNAVQPVRPAEVPRVMLAEQHQPWSSFESGLGYYPGAGSNSTDRPGTDRADPSLLLPLVFCNLCTRL